MYVIIWSRIVCDDYAECDMKLCCTCWLIRSRMVCTDHTLRGDVKLHCKWRDEALLYVLIWRYLFQVPLALGLCDTTAQEVCKTTLEAGKTGTAGNQDAQCRWTSFLCFCSDRFVRQACGGVERYSNDLTCIGLVKEKSWRALLSKQLERLKRKKVIIALRSWFLLLLHIWVDRWI